MRRKPNLSLSHGRSTQADEQRAFSLSLRLILFITQIRNVDFSVGDTADLGAA